MPYTVKPASPVLQTSDPLYSGLVAYWPFQGNGNDLFGTHNFTEVDPGAQTITWPTAGDDGQVVDRDTDANSDRLTLSGITSGTMWTVGFRLNLRTVNGGYNLIFSNATSALGIYAVTISSTKYYFQFYNGGTNISSDTGLALDQGSGYHSCVLTYDASATPKSKWYVDGVYSSTGNDTTTIASVVFDQAMSNASNQIFDGQFAQGAVWLNRVLNATEVSEWHSEPYRLITVSASGNVNLLKGKIGPTYLLQGKL